MASVNKNKVDILSKEEFSKFVASSNSYCDVIRKVGLSPSGATNKYVRDRIKREDVSIEHFYRNFGSKTPNGFKPELMFVSGSKANRGSLKRRGIELGFLNETCSFCGLGLEWNGKKLSLQLDHINGIYNDNRPENLRLLCPNCHSQTDTFAGKNAKVRERKAEVFSCKTCKKQVTARDVKCKECAFALQRKAPNLTKEILEKLVWEKPTAQIARENHLSDKAVEKRCKKFGVAKPPRGYWSQLLKK